MPMKRRRYAIICHPCHAAAQIHYHIKYYTSANEVPEILRSSPSVCLSVCLCTGYFTRLWTDLNQIMWRRRHWSKEEFWGISRSCILSPVQTERVDARRRGLLASNVCIFIQLSITSFSVTSLHCQ